jgi:hypothetical protein
MELIAKPVVVIGSMMAEESKTAPSMARICVAFISFHAIVKSAREDRH